MRPLVKVCGMREPENIRAIEALGIDLMGFIFWPKSSRYVSVPPAYLPTRCKRVGVFVNEDMEQVKRTASDYHLDILQLHGKESPDYLRELRSACSPLHSASNAPRSGYGCTTVPSHPIIIKAFNIATPDDLAQTAPYVGLADYFLFDTKGKSVGGNGEKFDWSVLSAYDGTTPFLLSGGIGPDDAPRLRQTLALDGFPVEKCIGIDLNSRFETAPGLKDIAALRHFLSMLP